MRAEFVMRVRVPLTMLDTFILARQKIHHMKALGQPMTFREIRHIYRATKSRGSIFLRCKFIADPGRERSQYGR